VQTKLNFWQWLGIVLLVVGIAWYAYTNWIKPNQTSPAAPTGPAAPTTTPVITSQPAK
jgi:hypothetical protein